MAKIRAGLCIETRSLCSMNHIAPFMCPDGLNDMTGGAAKANILCGRNSSGQEVSFRDRNGICVSSEGGTNDATRENMEMIQGAMGLGKVVPGHLIGTGIPDP